ncbi:MAG TPA: DUF2269 family protein [Gaiellaceae bacterium]
MDKTQWLLMLHIAAAFCLVGGSTAAAVLNALALRSERPSEAAFLLKLIRRSLPVIFAGVLGTLIFGVWLWHDLGFGFGTGWIWAALVFWALASALGGRGGRHQAQVREAAEKEAAAGDTMSAELRARLRDPKALAVNYAAGVATLAVLVIMIWKPGS